SAKRCSTKTEIRNPGNSRFNAATGLVNSRQSPIERRRTRRIRAFRGSLRKSSLVFNFRFADQHHRDVVANRVHAPAVAALQALSAFNKSYRHLAQRTNQDLKKLRVYSHSAKILPQETRSIGRPACPAASASRRQIRTSPSSE